MQLFYWQHPEGNVGDELNAWLWPRVFGEGAFTATGDAPDPAARFLGIGSILKAGNLLAPPATNIVFGPGLRSAASAREITDARAAGTRIDIRFVRGPLSAAALGGVPFICDPAILVAEHVARRDPVPGRIGFVPYFRTPKAAAARIAAETGTHLLPVTLDVVPFLDGIMSCEAVIAEAMHGAILADALRVPWAGCRITSSLYEGETSLFKWRDWQESLGLDVPLANVLPDAAATLPRRLRRLGEGLALRRGTGLVARLRREARYTLSDDTALATARARITAAAADLQAEQARGENSAEVGDWALKSDVL